MYSYVHRTIEIYGLDSWTVVNWIWGLMSTFDEHNAHTFQKFKAVNSRIHAAQIVRVDDADHRMPLLFFVLQAVLTSL
jgi:hypothetical protein